MNVLFGTLLNTGAILVGSVAGLLLKFLFAHVSPHFTGSRSSINKKLCGNPQSFFLHGGTEGGGMSSPDNRIDQAQRTFRKKRPKFQSLYSSSSTFFSCPQSESCQAGFPFIGTLP